MLLLGPLGFADGRKTISLDGQWQIAQGDDKTVPKASEFTRTVPVPGLADMAEPAFKDVGWAEKSKPLRDSFWYRTIFRVDGEVPPLARLKFHKVKYGCSVYLNGQHLGDAKRNFTPLYFDASKALKGNGAENELIVRVGADITNEMDKYAAYGADKEKGQYIPGIYDSVELIMTGNLYLDNLQVAPGAMCRSIIVQSTVFNNLPDRNMYQKIAYTIKDADGKVVATAQDGGSIHPRDGVRPKRLCCKVKHNITWKNMKLWTPETPYLYTIEAKLYSLEKGPAYSNKNRDDVICKLEDALTVRFGVRSFRFDRKTGYPMLNEKRYVLLGTSITIFRFFSDKNRGNLPWDREWVRKLIRLYKRMNWNCARFCIGFPPDFWYDIADEEGFLIEDEYAEWDWQEKVDIDIVEQEFRAWMHQRWNHPSVVIWDAQNEAWTYGQIPWVVSRVRGEDLSNRPWNMGWEREARATDPHESHYYPYGGWKKPPYPPISKCAARYRYSESEYGTPTIVNEYCSLWVNRDGSATYLAERPFEWLIGKNNTKEQRRLTAALYVSMLTEAFRRNIRGGVMHFVGLAYSNPGGGRKNGATSDSLCQLNPPKFDPYFEKYVKDSFSRVAMTLDVWERECKPGETLKVPLLLHNDSPEDWAGEVTVFIYKGDKVFAKASQKAKVAGYSKKEMVFEGLTVPKEKGVYRLESELFYKGESIRSRRRIYVK